MALELPIPVETIIAQCVESVSQRVLPQLIEANSHIQALSYMYGHPVELKNRLAEMSQSRTEKYLKFPVVMLFTDVNTSPSSVRGSFFDVTLNMVIAMSTEPTLTAPQRATTNFAPILRPIYNELIEELKRCGYFWIQSPRQILGYGIERFYWGRESIQGNGANAFNDYIDAIEIKNMRLTQSKKGTALTQNTFTQFMAFFLDQYRAEILVGTVTDNTISNTFFTTAILEIATGGQDYIEGVDFTQNTTLGTVTGITIEFYAGQTLIAKR